MRNAPVVVRRAVLKVPETRHWEFAVDPTFRLALIIHEVKTYNALQEDMQLGMARRILSDFEKGFEDVWR